MSTPEGLCNGSWEQVVTFCEVKDQASTKDEKESFRELSRKASCLLGAQDGRHFVSCIRMLGSSIYLTVFHRSGSISTCSYDINSSPLQFLRILIGVSFSDYLTIGFDTTIRWHRLDQDMDSNLPGPESTDDQISKGSKWVEVTDIHDERCLRVWLKSALAISDSLVGPGTIVWQGETNTNNGEELTVAVKDSWIDPLRKYTEGMILRILEKHHIEGVPTLVSEEQVKTQLRAPDHPHQDVNSSTHFLLSALPSNSSESFCLWLLSRLVTCPVGNIIIEFSSLGELLVAFLDCIVTHKNAVEIAGVLHRDISPTNLFLAFAKNRTDHSAYMHDLRGDVRVRLGQKIRSLKRRGVLGDWGYANPEAASPTPTSSKAASLPSVSPNRVPTSKSLAASPTSIPSETTSQSSSSPDAVPTSPVEAADEPVVEYDKRVPVRKVGSNDTPKLLSISQLTNQHDIVLLMGNDDPSKDPRRTIDTCPLYHTGTWPWMAAQLLMARPGQPVTHDALHDLESFFYVLVGICTLYDGPFKQKSENDLAESYDILFNTFEPGSVLRTITIQSNLGWGHYVLRYIHPYFKSLIPLLTALRSEIISPLAADEHGNCYRESSCNHDTFIKHIITALSGLKPHDWADMSPKATSDGTSRRPSSEVTSAQSQPGPPEVILPLAPPAVPKNDLPGHDIIQSDPGVLHRSTERSLGKRARESDSDDFLPPSPSKRTRMEPS